MEYEYAVIDSSRCAGLNGFEEELNEWGKKGYRIFKIVTSPDNLHGHNRIVVFMELERVFRASPPRGTIERNKL